MRIPQRIEPLSMFNINCGNLALRLLILKIMNGEAASIGEVAFHGPLLSRIEPCTCQEGDTSLTKKRGLRIAGLKALALSFHSVEERSSASGSKHLSRSIVSSSFRLRGETARTSRDGFPF